MQITIPDELGESLKAEAADQLPRCSATQLAVAILELAMTACGLDDEPYAWRTRLQRRPHGRRAAATKPVASTATGGDND